jgi:hypothetical protein
MQVDENFTASTEEHITRTLKRGRVVIAINDLVALIGDDPDLLELVRRSKLAKKLKRPRGREKGEKRPLDRTSDERRRCETALQYEKRIQALWVHQWGRRGPAPMAFKIAAASQGLSTARLTAYRKNKSPA